MVAKVFSSAALGAAGVSLVETEMLLYAPGWQPARPVVDDGIDLRVISRDGSKVYNLQVKAGAAWSFNMRRKWEHIPNFLGVYICNFKTREQAEVYVLRFEDIIAVLDKWMPTGKFRSTLSWNQRSGDAGYGTWKTTPKLIAAMQAFRATPEPWRAVLQNE
jgi:hypothetical protein